MSVKLTTKRAAEYLGTTPATMRQWRLKGYGPKYYKLTANRAVYDQNDLDAFLDERKFKSTTEESAKAA